MAVRFWQIVAAGIGLTATALAFAAPAAAQNHFNDLLACIQADIKDRIKVCSAAANNKNLPDSVRSGGYYYRARAWRERNDLDRAIADFTSAIRLGGGTSSFEERGDAWMEKGNLDLAIADYSEAIRLAVTLYEEHVRTVGQERAGIAAISMLNPYVRRAEAYERKGMREQAVADYAAAAQIDLGPTPDASTHNKKSRQHARDRLAALAPAAAAPTSIAAGSSTTEKSAALPADPGRRVALVIGNSGYRAVPALPNPRKDADTVASALRAIGFQSVIQANDLSREKLVDALRSFAAEAEKADWALVYFAGHGIELGGSNYLIPVDAKLAADRDVQFEAVSLEQVMTSVEGAKKLKLVMLDACRDNPFAQQMRRTVATRSLGRGLAQIEPDSGTLVVYAAKHGQVALDGEGANSPFVSAFVKRLSQPGLEIRKLFDLVRDDVMVATARRQQPFSYGSVPGSEDFFFTAR
jgi:tetratricopeptide (TPR) repeat protein